MRSIPIHGFRPDDNSRARIFDYVKDDSGGEFIRQRENGKTKIITIKELENQITQARSKAVEE